MVEWVKKVLRDAARGNQHSLTKCARVGAVEGWGLSVARRNPRPLETGVLHLFQAKISVKT